MSNLTDAQARPVLSCPDPSWVSGTQRPDREGQVWGRVPLAQSTRFSTPEQLRALGRDGLFRPWAAGSSNAPPGACSPSSPSRGASYSGTKAV